MRRLLLTVCALIAVTATAAAAAATFGPQAAQTFGRQSVQTHSATHAITLGHKKKHKKKKKHHSGDFKIGQTMTNGAHQTVTVTSFTPNSPASEFSTPNPGDQCVQINVSLRNGDSSPWLDPLDELAVVDGEGQSYDDLAFDCQGTSSEIDSLVVGGQAQAVLFFEVPAAGKLTLQWTPSIFNANSNYNTLLKP
ncbi:MAG: DUF4352 domain-containing protein [Candidatus Dormiibacterota bacterium]